MRHLVLFIRTGGVIFALAACGLPAPSEHPEVAAVVPRAAVSFVGATSPPAHELGMSRPDAVLVDQFDWHIQARFQDLRDEVFGVSRVGRLGPQHRRIFEPKDHSERLALEGLRTAGWTTSMYVVGPRSKSGAASEVQGPVDTEQAVILGPRAQSKIEGLAAYAMTARSPAFGDIDGVPMEARPVLASSKACLECHSRRKLGDPLGAVVYSFLTDRSTLFVKQ